MITTRSDTKTVAAGDKVGPRQDDIIIADEKLQLAGVLDTIEAAQPTINQASS